MRHTGAKYPPHGLQTSVRTSVDCSQVMNGVEGELVVESEVTEFVISEVKPDEPVKIVAKDSDGDTAEAFEEKVTLVASEGAIVNNETPRFVKGEVEFIPVLVGVTEDVVLIVVDEDSKVRRFVEGVAAVAVD